MENLIFILYAFQHVHFIKKIDNVKLKSSPGLT